MILAAKLKIMLFSGTCFQSIDNQFIIDYNLINVLRACETENIDFKG